jgi:hypothetical protein
MISVGALSSPAEVKQTSRRPWPVTGYLYDSVWLYVHHLKVEATSGIAVTRLDNQHHCNYGPKLITR